MNKVALKKKRTLRRKLSIKRKLHSDKNCNKLRLCISKSNNSIYVQIIDDQNQKTLVGLSTLSKELSSLKNKGNIAAAKELGKLLAEKAQQNGIKKVIFDRNGYLYHGKVKAFADSAREGGLEF
jgi:large subunit ribosomal protein L18